MIQLMPKRGVKSELSRAITRGRKHAGSMTKLVAALGKPRINIRSLEAWEAERYEPAEFAAAAVIERIERLLKN